MRESGVRYVTSDPIGLDGGLNTYGYVDANPLMYFDNEGLSKRGSGRPNSRIERKAQRLRSRIQGLRDRMKNSEKKRQDRLRKGREEAELLDHIGDLLEELDRLENYLPTRCVRWQCPWDEPEPSQQCPGDPEPSFTPLRVPSSRCKCVEEAFY